MACCTQRRVRPLVKRFGYERVGKCVFEYPAARLTHEGAVHEFTDRIEDGSFIPTARGGNDVDTKRLAERRSYLRESSGIRRNALRAGRDCLSDGVQCDGCIGQGAGLSISFQELYDKERVSRAELRDGLFDGAKRLCILDYATDDYRYIPRCKALERYGVSASFLDERCAQILHQLGTRFLRAICGYNEDGERSNAASQSPQ
jgi:hypothetical protein